jgi:hypothetical protein
MGVQHLNMGEIGAGAGVFHRYLSTGTLAGCGKMGVRRLKNLALSGPDVLHSCYEYNYISPSIGLGS